MSEPMTAAGEQAEQAWRADWGASVPGQGRYTLGHEAHRATFIRGYDAALAAAEAAGRVSALEADSQHDDLMATLDEWNVHSRGDFLRLLRMSPTDSRIAALAAPASPAGVSYPRVPLTEGYVWCESCTGQGVLQKVEPLAPAPTPSEPVGRFTDQDEWPCVCGHVKRRHHFGDTPAIDGSFGAWCQADPMHCIRFRPFTPATRDE